MRVGADMVEVGVSFFVWNCNRQLNGFFSADFRETWLEDGTFLVKACQQEEMVLICCENPN